jgi:hypothetical protein
MTEQVKQGTQQVAQQAQVAAGQATSLAQSQKDRAGESLSMVAQALRQTGQNLDQQGQGTVGQLAGKAADQVERVSGYLRERDVNQLIFEVEDYARRNTALFLGGAFALGMLAARFLKSSSPSSTQGGYGPQPRRYQNAPYRYEDVQGMPNVERRYAPGMTNPNAGFTTGSSRYAGGSSYEPTGTAATEES